jgi:hypothetical protein
MREMRRDQAFVKRALYAATLLAIVGCSNPHNQSIPADLKAAADDKSFQASVEKLPPGERELLAGYLMRATMAEAFTGGVTKGERAKTIGDAIVEQRKFLDEQKAKEAEEKALAEKVAAERAAAVKAMEDVLTVALTGKTVLPADMNAGRFGDRIKMSVAFKNKSNKDVAGVKGRLIFKDIFGDKIKSVGLKVDDPIAAGGTYVWEGGMDANQFMQEDTKLANTPLEKLKVVWEPNSYLFKDGSSLKAPDGP